MIYPEAFGVWLWDVRDWANRANARIGDQICLLGYNIVPPPRAGQTLPITLYGEMERDILEDLTGFVHLLDDSGEIVAQRELEQLAIK